jgi:hypothetical protein
MSASDFSATATRVFGAIALFLALLSAGIHALAYYMEYQFRFHRRPEPPHIPIFDGYYYPIAWSAFGVGIIALPFLLASFRPARLSFSQKAAIVLLLPTAIDGLRIANFVFPFIW